jgi:hypothetical protein
MIVTIRFHDVTIATENLPDVDPRLRVSDISAVLR